jgi:hypothetical protein
MRSEEEIKFVREIIMDVIKTNNIHEFDLDTLIGMAEASDMLCWVLGHKHPTLFEARMKALKEFVESRKPEEFPSDPEDKNRLN